MATDTNLKISTADRYPNLLCSRVASVVDWGSPLDAARPSIDVSRKQLHSVVCSATATGAHIFKGNWGPAGHVEGISAPCLVFIAKLLFSVTQKSIRYLVGCACQITLFLFPKMSTFWVANRGYNEKGTVFRQWLVGVHICPKLIWLGNFWIRSLKFRFLCRSRSGGNFATMMLFSRRPVGTWAFSVNSWNSSPSMAMSSRESNEKWDLFLFTLWTEHIPIELSVSDTEFGASSLLKRITPLATWFVKSCHTVTSSGWVLFHDEFLAFGFVLNCSYAATNVQTSVVHRQRALAYYSAEQNGNHLPGWF